MENNIVKRAVSLFLALMCVIGALPLSAFAASSLSSAPSTITQSYCDYMYIDGRSVRYESASDVINAEGLPYVFHERVTVPGLDNTIRALCSYHAGSLGGEANGQKWSFKKEVTDPSLKVMLTWIYARTYGDLTDAGNAAGLEKWGNYWSDIWFLVGQAMTWYYEYGIILDVNADREAFIEQASEEFVAAMKLYHKTSGQSSWITDWDSITTHSIIDSKDGGVTGYSAYDYISTGVNMVLDHPEYFHKYHLWEYEWDTTQPWKLVGHSSTEMQRLLITVPDPEDTSLPVSLTVKKLEAGANKPLAGVTFKVESAVNPALFSVTRTTGSDGTFTLTQEADNLVAGQYRITEIAAPEGYTAQAESQLVTVLPGDTVDNTFTFYNVPTIIGSGAIRKVNADNPTVGIPGAVIRITSVKLDDGGSFTGTYTTGDGGYISTEDLDFTKLPKGSYLAEEITPPEGFILSSDVAKVRQAFVWDGVHDVSLIFENSAKVKVELKKVDENGSPLAGAVFLVLRDGQIISTEETKADGTITVSNVTEGYYEFREVSAPAGFDCDRTPAGVHVNAEDLQGEQTITVTKVNYHKRALTISKRDAETGAPVANTSFHIRGVNVSYENDVVTGTDGKAILSDMSSGCYEITETNVPAPYLLDTNNRRTVWIDASEGQDVVVDFVNSTRPGLRLMKTDHETGKPIAGVTFLIEQVGGGYSEQHVTDADGLIVLENLEPGAYTITEVKPAPGYVADATPRTVWLEKNRTTTLELTNVRKPDLRILKYDQQSGNPLAGVTFEVWHNSELLGEYTTDSNGEIYLSGLELGTYLVKEVATDDEHVVNTTPQQIELTADRTETAQLVFFNSKKPGIHLIKVDSVTMKSLPNVRFEFKKVGGSYKQEFITDVNGEIDLSKLEPGAYEVRELEAPDGYLIDDAVRVVQVNPDEDASFVFTNTPKPSLRLIKTSSDGSRLGGVHFRIAKIEDGTHYLDHITDENGEISISDLEPGVYSVKETATVSDHIIDVREYHVELFAGQTSTLTIENQKRPNLTIRKTDKDTGDPVPGVTFTLRGADGPTITTEPTGPDGTVTVENLLPGVYTVTEQNVPEGYILDATPQTVTLFANRNATVQFQNYKRPALKLAKVDINGKPLTGAIFEVKTKAGVKIGDFPVGADGTVTIPNIHLDEGYYIVTEKQAPTGYILDSTPHEVYLRPGKTTELTIENEKKPGLTIYKVDSVVGDGIKGAKFEIFVTKDKDPNGTYRKLDGSYYSDADGLIRLENLDTGWYRIVEVEPPAGYLLKEPSEQTVYVEHDKAVEVTFENTPKSALVIRKIDAATGEPLANAWFRVRYLGGTSGSGGTIIGEYQTSANGNIIITGLDAGTYICEEISAPHGYVMDTAPQTAYISGKQQDCITLTFTNSKYGSLLVKKVDSVTGDPLSDVQFFVATSDGVSVGSSNGYFTTDSAGTILIPDIKPGTTLIARETRAKSGYALDNTAQTALIHSGETATLEFRNQPEGSLLIRKVCATNPSVTLQNAEFKVTYADGTLVSDSNGVYRSDENGEIHISGLIPGKSVVVTETRAPAGFTLDTQSQTAQIKAGKTVSLTFKNQPKGKLIVQKRDSQTNEVLPGAEFRVTTAAGCEVGLDGVIGTATLTSNGIFTTDAQGEIRISNLAPGAYVLTEIKAPDGYVIDTASTNVVIGTGGDTQTVIIKDTKKGNLVIEKYDSVTKQPLSGTRFKITTASGELVANNEGMTSSNGLYTTDVNGQITLSKLLPGTYIVTEDKAPDNYRKDSIPQTVVVNAGDTQTVKFYDDPLCTLTILKRDSVTKKPLKGAEFTVRDSSGKVIGPNNGLYTTDTDGTATVTGLAPNATIVVSESRAPSGYILNETPKNIVVRSGAANSLTFDNEPGTTLIIRKFIEGTENEPLSGVTFKVVDGSGAAVGPDDGIYHTDKAGEIVLEGIEPGTTVKVREIKTVEGYVLDGTPQDIKIVGGQAQTLTFWNKRAGTLVIQKKDSVSGALISGAQFQLTYANGGYVDADNGHLSSNGLYTTDANGEIRISGITGTIVAKEVKAAPGYVIDSATQTQTVTVNPLDTQTLVFRNDPLCSLTITKLDSVTGKPVPGTVFAVKDGNGNVLGRYTTGQDGTVTVTGLVPGSTAVVAEVSVPDGYVLDTTPKTITVKNGNGNSVTSGGTATGTGNGNDLTFENDPQMTLTIHKYIEGTANEPLAGVAFKVVDGSGAAVGTGDGVYYTNAEGDIKVTGIEPGTTVTVREVKTVEGFVLDGTPKTVKVTAGQPAPELTFWNKRDCSLTILKQSTSKEPLPGAVFHITDEDGAAIGTNNGRYTSDRNGLITITGLQPGQVLVVTEEKAPDGYVLDTTPKTIKIKQDVANSLIFENAKAGSLVINKRSSADKKTPLEGVTFKITTTSGAFLPDENGKIRSNGLYYTDENGQIVLNSVVGTLVVTEVATIDGYTIHDANRSQTVEVKPDDTQTLYFYNDPLCSLTLTKLDSVTGKPVPNTTFLVKYSNGVEIGRYTTGKDGTVTVTGLVPGSTAVVTETSAPSGYVLDPTPQTVTVKSGDKNSITFENDPKTSLVIEKFVTGTTTPLKGVAFLVTDSSGAVVGSSNGEFITDENGRIVIEGLEPGVTVTAKEIRALEGYVLDTTPKSIKIKVGEAQTMRFYNQKQGALVIRKLDSVTKKPLAGVEFQLTYANGGYVDADNGHLSSNGLYTTDKNGEIRISGVTGTIVVKETRTIDGYTIDPDTCTQTVKVNSQDTQTLTFYNAPKQTLTIQKYVDGTTTPIQGVTFLVTDSSGQYVGPNNGEFITDKNGRIVLTDLTPGTTITARETRTVSGYVLDSTPQSILIKQGAAQALTFFNKAEGGLELIKVSEADTTQRIPGVTFEIRRMDGGLVETVTTGKDGRVCVNLDAGDYYAVETETAQGFKLDNTPHYFTVKDGKTTTLTVKNKPLSGILIHKTDSATGKGLYGVNFLLYDAANTPIGQYTSDNSGYVYIEGLTAGGRYYLRELENPGYVPDTQMKTVYVKAGETTLVEWQNTPITGQIQVTKTSADYNSLNGWPAGTPIPGTEFEIYNYRTGVLVDTIRTDKNGVAVSKPLPLGRYKVVESKAADFYSLDKTPIEAELEHAGQIVKVAMTNKSLYTNVSIKKTGYAEVMPGQSIRYTFSEIGNNSNTSLTSFYWRDTLPVDAVRLDKIVTGTYNAAGSYKVVYKTNLSGGKTYTMYDNLSTAKNYVLDASAAALKLASSEYVTEFSFVFGVVPANFRQVEAPQVYCNVVSWAKGGSQFTNTADVGGVYNGQWIQAVTRWTTKVYGKPATLPKTGY